LDTYFPRDMAQHDNRAMHDALRSFSTLVQQFPDSRYAADAYQHMLHLRNKLAEAELHAANYYIKRQAWLAAAKRGQYILENYPTTPASRDALKIMVQAYQQLGMDDLAGAAQLVLDTNQQKDSQQLAVLKETAQLDQPAYQ
ncbi:MAG TPA: outer membrane protein assembly factor BamD, partial [Gammaproteobacteria bacterium]